MKRKRSCALHHLPPPLEDPSEAEGGAEAPLGVVGEVEVEVAEEGEDEVGVGGHNDVLLESVQECVLLGLNLTQQIKHGIHIRVGIYHRCFRDI